MILSIQKDKKVISFTPLEQAKNPNTVLGQLLKKVVVFHDEEFYHTIKNNQGLKVLDHLGNETNSLQDLTILKDKKLPKIEPLGQYILFTTNVLVIDKIYIDEFYFSEPHETLTPFTDYTDSIKYTNNMKQVRKDYIDGRFGNFNKYSIKN